MKSSIIVFLLCCTAIPHLIAQENSKNIDSVMVIQDFKNLYRYQNFHLSGQPTYEMLLWLKTVGVKKIVNLRSEKETSDFSASREAGYDDKLYKQRREDTFALCRCWTGFRFFYGLFG